MRTIAALLLPVLATACTASAGGPSTAPASPPHACALLTPVEAAAITGEPMREAQEGPDAPASGDVTSSQCVYPSSDGSRTLGVLVRHSKKGDNEPGFARKAIADSGLPVEDVPGVGDTAFWYGTQLQAYEGRHLQVVVTAIGLDRARERAAAAASRVLEKL
jgi:hypothetical protein